MNPGSRVREASTGRLGTVLGPGTPIPTETLGETQDTLVVDYDDMDTEIIGPQEVSVRALIEADE